MEKPTKPTIRFRYFNIKGRGKRTRLCCWDIWDSSCLVAQTASASDEIIMELSSFSVALGNNKN